MLCKLDNVPCIAWPYFYLIRALFIKLKVVLFRAGLVIEEEREGTGNMAELWKCLPTPTPSPCICKLKHLQEREGYGVRVQLCLFQEAPPQNRGCANRSWESGRGLTKICHHLDPTN